MPSRILSDQVNAWVLGVAKRTLGVSKGTTELIWDEELEKALQSNPAVKQDVFYRMKKDYQAAIHPAEEKPALTQSQQKQKARESFARAGAKLPVEEAEVGCSTIHEITDQAKKDGAKGDEKLNQFQYGTASAILQRMNAAIEKKEAAE